MKKLLAILLAGLMLMTTMSVVAWADDEEPVGDVIAGYEFSTFGEFYEFKDTLTDEVVSEAGTVDTETYKRILGTDGLYLPSGYSLEDVESFFTAPSYTSVDFEFEGVTLSLIYGSISSGYSTAKEYAESGKYSGKVLETDGVTVYYYNFSGTYEGTVREDLTYWWVKDGKTYELRLQGYHSSSETGYEELYVDELLAMCNAVYHSFGEAYNFTVEALDGKAKLSWDEVVEGETYTVYWKRSSSDEWKVAGTTTKHKVNISGLKNGVSYDFKIEATGLESEIVTVTAE